MDRGGIQPKQLDWPRLALALLFDGLSANQRLYQKNCHE